VTPTKREAASGPDRGRRGETQRRLRWEHPEGRRDEANATVAANIARRTFPAGSGPRGGEARSALLQSPTPQTWAPSGEGLGHDPGGYGLTMRAVRYEARARTLAHDASTTMSTPLWGNPVMPRRQVNRARGTPKSTTDGGRQLCMTGNGYAWDGRTQKPRLLQRR